MLERLKSLFNRNTKESRAWPAILSVSPRGPQWMTPNYQAFAQEGYIWNADVYACINKTVSAFRGVKFGVYKDKGDGRELVTDGALADLIRRPNSHHSWSSIAGEWAGSMELAGNAYIEGVSTNGKDSEILKVPPKELFILRPDRMFVVPGDNAQIPVAGFEYRAGAVVVPYKTQMWRDPQSGGFRPRLPVCHSKYWHPLNDWYGLCYSKDTEILTKDRGWVLFANLLPSDAVATRNCETKEFEWQLPTAHINRQYSGEMCHFSSRSVDLLVTPEHRMLVLSRDGSRRERELIRSAKDLSSRSLKSGHVKIPMSSTWNGIEVPEMVFPWVKHNGDWTVKISGDDYCALMGAYLAEGNIRKRAGIEINQKRESKGFELYDELLTRINGKSCYNGRAFIVSRQSLTSHFRRFGKCHEKFVPEIILNATKRQLQIFWEYYLAGDGHYSTVPNRTQRGRHPRQRAEAVTNSISLADHLVEIAQKLGYSASVYARKGGPTTICGVPCSTRKSYKVRVRYSDYAAVTSCETVDYSGTIHCVSVPNGIVYVRRNGKPAWCGNSPIEAAAKNIDAFNSAVAWNVALTQNTARPSGIFSSTETISATQAEEYSNLIRQKFSGAQGAGRPMILGMGLTWQQMGLSPTDMDWLNGLEWNTRKICAVFGIPPQLISDETAKTFANFAEASRAVWMQKWLNMLDHFCEDLNTWLTPLFYEAYGDDTLTIGYDRDSIEAIQEDRQVKWANAVSGTAFLMVDEQRALLGYDPLPNGIGQTVLVPVGAVPLSVSAKQRVMPQQIAAQAASDRATAIQGQQAPKPKPGKKPKKKSDEVINHEFLEESVATARKTLAGLIESTQAENVSKD